MEIGTQLAVFLENRPGTLARVCEALGDAGINIFAISTSDTVDHTVVRMVVSDARKAIFLLEERGTLLVENEVLLLDGDNRPGSLAALAHRLADHGVNIEYLYSASNPEADRGLMVLRVSDAAKALKVLSARVNPRAANPNADSRNPDARAPRSNPRLRRCSGFGVLQRTGDALCHIHSSTN